MNGINMITQVNIPFGNFEVFKKVAQELEINFTIVEERESSLRVQFDESPNTVFTFGLLLGMKLY